MHAKAEGSGDIVQINAGGIRKTKTDMAFPLELLATSF
jgi:hypothetical protein